MSMSHLRDYRPRSADHIDIGNVTFSKPNPDSGDFVAQRSSDEENITRLCPHDSA